MLSVWYRVLVRYMLRRTSAADAGKSDWRLTPSARFTWKVNAFDLDFGTGDFVRNKGGFPR